ncbi:MAG TPA: uroporphyrinogen-III synthase [Gallionellaceae bacterium]
MNSASPLSGLTILVTRPREQAAVLAQRIEALGGQPLIFPLLEITSLSDSPALRAQVAQLADYDLAIFISPNAARHGMQAILAAGPLPAGLRIASVGPGSSKVLRELGVSEVLEPHGQFDSEALLALPELQAVQGWRVQIFRGESGRELLGESLKARGAQVEYAACYQRSKPQQDACVLLQQRLDALTASSSEALGYLNEMLGPAGQARLAGLPLFVPHPKIAEAARKLGWHQVIATAGADDGLLAGLVTWATQRAQSSGSQS